ncbi:ArsA family ATPase [Halomarina oriensis]|uniref:TRC40/GET3/ArsA family transport-energizing ATPase n=1 Tax=Halomarina oriensis TaxID=671145 RepID=A0A6B0GRD0_9EURY|nr:TRC40/GET3/ArsA family transport-energizing ATPase [Halomarina oriensis]MWG35243.1 TRC40/GET3/ArsA family transport-energizing ATPase [Halomarina oriensis]
MSSIEVEAVEEIDAEDVTPEGVDAPDYVLYGGKGGVGKTTMAAATALASANDGTPTLAVSTDPAHSLSDVLGTSIPDEPTRIRDDMPLYAVEIDPERADDPLGGAGGPGGMGGVGGMGDAGPGTDTDEQGGSGPFGGMGGLGGMDGFGAGGNSTGDDGFGVNDGFDAANSMFGGTNPMGGGGGAMPGDDETAAMQLLLQYMDDERFDRVVVDTAPTGHTLRLLRLPEALDTMLGQMLQLRERMSGMLGDMPGPFGNPDATDVGGLREFADRVERLRDALRDPEKTDFRVVMVPETLSVIESERLLRELGDYGVNCSTVVVNRVTESIENVADVDADAFVTPDPEHCAFCSRRWESQQKALQRANEVFRGKDVKRVPLFAEEVSGESMLRVVAACLA